MPRNENLLVCHSCYFRSGLSGRDIFCSISSIDIADHAERGDCPLNFFTDPLRREKWNRKSRPDPCETILTEAMKIDPKLDLQEWRIRHGIVEPEKEEVSTPDPNHLVLVRLESCGDVLVMLPAMNWLHEQGHKVTFVTYKRYAPLVEGLNWLNVIGVEEPTTRNQAILRYSGIGTIRDVVPIVRKRLYSPWDKSLWIETGVDLSLFESLPLQIENRDEKAERRLIRLYRRHPRKPLILLNLMAYTAPFPEGDRMRYMLMSWYGRDFEIVDLGLIRAKRIIDLLGLYERAACLISCDTGTLHLGYATRTPTVALVSDGQGPRSPGASSPRPHWICRLRYGKATTDAGLKMIRERIDGLFHLPKRADEARVGSLEKMTTR